MHKFHKDVDGVTTVLDNPHVLLCRSVLNSVVDFGHCQVHCISGF